MPFTMSLLLKSVAVGLLVLMLTIILKKLYKFILWKRRINAAFGHFHGPKPHWLLGNVLQIKNFHEFLMKMLKEADSSEKAFVHWLSITHPAINLTHPDTIKVVMKTTSPKPAPFINFLEPWIGDGLLSTKGKKWERNRRLLTPAFHFNILNGYFKIYNDVADTLLEKLSADCSGGKYVEVFKYTSLATLDTLLQCSLSYKGDVQRVGESHVYPKSVKRLEQIVLERSLKIYLYPDCLFKLSSKGKEFYRLCNNVHRFAESIISKRKDELLHDADKQPRQLDFLDILLTAKDEQGFGLTDKEIRAEVDTFMFAALALGPDMVVDAILGHDTTSSVLSWSIYSLGKHKDIQEKVYRDIRSVIGNRNNITRDDISHMSYLGCFLKEVMRHHTPVPIISRLLEEPCVIDGVEIPEGVSANMCIYHAHHHPDVWEDPWEFKPERFEDNKYHDMDPYSFIPFSAGPRNCIGQTFALNEEKVLVARLVNRFEISLDNDHEVEHFIEIVMRAKNGIMASFKERK